MLNSQLYTANALQHAFQDSVHLQAQSAMQKQTPRPQPLTALHISKAESGEEKHGEDGDGIHTGDPFQKW